MCVCVCVCARRIVCSVFCLSSSPFISLISEGESSLNLFAMPVELIFTCAGESRRRISEWGLLQYRRDAITLVSAWPSFREKHVASPSLKDDLLGQGARYAQITKVDRACKAFRGD